MTLEMELAKMLAPKLVALDLDPLLLALESDLPHMDLALWDQLDFEWARRNCSLDQPPVDLAKPKGEDAGSRTASFFPAPTPPGLIELAPCLGWLSIGDEIPLVSIPMVKLPNLYLLEIPPSIGTRHVDIDWPRRKTLLHLHIELKRSLVSRRVSDRCLIQVNIFLLEVPFPETSSLYRTILPCPGLSPRQHS